MTHAHAYGHSVLVGQGELCNLLMFNTPIICDSGVWICMLCLCYTWKAGLLQSHSQAAHESA